MSIQLNLVLDTLEMSSAAVPLSVWTIATYVGLDVKSEQFGRRYVLYYQTTQAHDTTPYYWLARFKLKLPLLSVD